MKDSFCIGDIIGGNKGGDSDEAYRQVLLARLRRLAVLMIAGVVLLVVAGGALLWHWNVALRETGLCYLLGGGVGLVAGASLKAFQTLRILHDPEALHRARLTYGDEREREISKRSFIIAGYAMLAALYLIGFIGGLFYPILMSMLGIIIAVFLLAYLIAHRVLSAAI